MSVTLSEVKRAARAHRAPLAGESAGYLVLALADQVSSAPRLIQPADIELTEDGGLRVLRGQASSEGDAELSLRRALDGLLLVASSGSAALMRASRRASPVGMTALVRELEAALIPVNRGAARRALARVHRETARALASGLLPDEAPESRLDPEPQEDELETRALALQAPAGIDLPPLNLDAVESALCGDSGTLPETSPLSDALTVALDVRRASTSDELAAPREVVGLSDEDVSLDEPAEPDLDEHVELDEDVEFIDEEPSDALTIMRNLEVLPIPLRAGSEEARVELPEEACTRPEPIILRQALRSLAEPKLPPTAIEVCSSTPTLGSLAAELPNLLPEQIAELSAAQAALRAADAPVEPPEPVEAASGSGPEVAELVLCSAGPEECTEPMPDVAPLLPGVAIVASRKSDVSELLENFQVAQDDTNQGLCRAIKEMAGLDLTPAPFAALIR